MRKKEKCLNCEVYDSAAQAWEAHAKRLWKEIDELEKVIVAADGVTPFTALTRLTELADATTQMFEEE